MNGEKKVYALLTVMAAAIIISAGNICYHIISILNFAR
jgi:hypothetical protein